MKDTSCPFPALGLVSTARSALAERWEGEEGAPRREGDKAEGELDSEWEGDGLAKTSFILLPSFFGREISLFV